jgi:nitrogen fixation NifU-like protein
VPVDEELLGDAVALGGASRFVARVKCALLAWVAAEAALAKR